MRRIKKKYREILIKLSLLIITLLFFSILFEVTLRIIEPEPKYEREDVFKLYDVDKILGWKNKVNVNEYFNMPDSRSLVTTNSKGYRDIERDYNKQEGKKRILIYGDSMTWGYGVNNSDRFSVVMEKKLGKNYEILNMGVAGYGTDQEFLSYINDGYKFNADTVILVYNRDIVDIISTRSHQHDKPKFILEEGELKVIYSETKNEERKDIALSNWLSRNSKAYNFILQKILSITIFKDLAYEYSNKDSFYEEHFKVLDELLLEFNKKVTENNSEFIIVLLPYAEHIYSNAHTIEMDHIEEFGNSNSITTIRLLPDIKESGFKFEEIYFPIDRHYSVKGNELIAEKLINKLNK